MSIYVKKENDELEKISSLGLKNITQWGDITGDIQNQQDLQQELNTKVDVSQTHEDIKTSINHNEGKVEIQAQNTNTEEKTVIEYTSKGLNQGTEPLLEVSGDNEPGVIPGKRIKHDETLNINENGELHVIGGGEGGTATWGDITGELDNQTDLHDRLAALLPRQSGDGEGKIEYLPNGVISLSSVHSAETGPQSTLSLHNGAIELANYNEDFSQALQLLMENDNIKANNNKIIDQTGLAVTAIQDKLEAGDNITLTLDNGKLKIDSTGGSGSVAFNQITGNATDNASLKTNFDNKLDDHYAGGLSTIDLFYKTEQIVPSLIQQVKDIITGDVLVELETNNAGFFVNTCKRFAINTYPVVGQAGGIRSLDDGDIELDSGDYVLTLDNQGHLFYGKESEPRLPLVEVINNVPKINSERLRIDDSLSIIDGNLHANGGGSSGDFASITGSPYDNTNLKEALDDKVSAYTVDGYDNGSISNSPDNIELRINGRKQDDTTYTRSISVNENNGITLYSKEDNDSENYIDIQPEGKIDIYNYSNLYQYNPGLYISPGAVKLQATSSRNSDSSLLTLGDNFNFTSGADEILHLGGRQDTEPGLDLTFKHKNGGIYSRINSNSPSTAETKIWASRSNDSADTDYISLGNDLGCVISTYKDSSTFTVNTGTENGDIESQLTVGNNNIRLINKNNPGLTIGNTDTVFQSGGYPNYSTFRLSPTGLTYEGKSLNFTITSDTGNTNGIKVTDEGNLSLTSNNYELTLDREGHVSLNKAGDTLIPVFEYTEDTTKILSERLKLDETLNINENGELHVIGGGEGGTATWGDITGELDNQTDLVSALNSKVNTHYEQNNVTIDQTFNSSSPVDYEIIRQNTTSNNFERLRLSETIIALEAGQSNNQTSQVALYPKRVFFDSNDGTAIPEKTNFISVPEELELSHTSSQKDNPDHLLGIDTEGIYVRGLTPSGTYLSKTYVADRAGLNTDAVLDRLEAGANITLTKDTDKIRIDSTGGGGGTNWGSITGTLDNQTDLVTKLEDYALLENLGDLTQLRARQINLQTVSDSGETLAARIALTQIGLGITVDSNTSASFAYNRIRLTNGDAQMSVETDRWEVLTGPSDARHSLTFNTSGELLVDGKPVGGTTDKIEFKKIYTPEDNKVVVELDRNLTDQDTVVFYNGTTGEDINYTEVAGDNPYTYTFSSLPGKWGVHID